MDSLGDILKRKADAIDIEAKQDELSIANAIVQRRFPQARLSKITPRRDGIINVKAAPLASEVRFGQTLLLEEINKSIKPPLNKLIIRLN